MPEFKEFKKTNAHTLHAVRFFSVFSTIKEINDTNYFHLYSLYFLFRKSEEIPFQTSPVVVTGTSIHFKEVVLRGKYQGGIGR